ncbi:unnamed protein product [Somion occarium]
MSGQSLTSSPWAVCRARVGTMIRIVPLSQTSSLPSSTKLSPFISSSSSISGLVPPPTKPVTTTPSVTPSVSQTAASETWTSIGISLLPSSPPNGSTYLTTSNSNTFSRSLSSQPSVFATSTTSSYSDSTPYSSSARTSSTSELSISIPESSQPKSTLVSTSNIRSIATTRSDLGTSRDLPSSTPVTTPILSGNETSTSSRSGMSHGAIAGVVVGVVVFLFLVGITCILVRRKLKLRTRESMVRASSLASDWPNYLVRSPTPIDHMNGNQGEDPTQILSSCDYPRSAADVERRDVGPYLQLGSNPSTPTSAVHVVYTDNSSNDSLRSSGRLSDLSSIGVAR